MKHILTILITLLSISSFAQGTINANQGSVENKTYFSSIPYQELNGKIIIEIAIEDVNYKFLLDTGAPTSISKRLLKTIATKPLGKVKITDQSGLVDSLEVVKVPRITIDGINFIDTPAFVSNNDSAPFYSCLNIEGIIGSNLLRNSVIQFNSKKKQVTIANDSKDFNLKRKDALEMKKDDIQSNPFIKIQLKKEDHTGNEYVLIDSGDNSFYVISNAVYHELEPQINVFEVLAEGKGSFSMGLFGTAEDSEHLAIKIPMLQMGRTQFANVLTKTTYGHSSRIGSEIFDYGIVTLDYHKGRFWFEPFTQEQPLQLSEKLWGIEPVLNNENELVVGIIWDKTLEDQIKVGDRILKLDDIDYSAMDFCEIMNSSFKVSKPEALLTIEDNATKEIKSITLRRL